MNKPWAAHYPDGVPLAIDDSRYRSVVALMDESFRLYRERVAYVCMGRELTFGQLNELSRSMAGSLQAAGMTQGDRVAIMLPNLLQFPVALAAILRAGFIAVPVNPSYTARELKHQLADSGARAIIIFDQLVPMLQEVQSDTEIAHVVVAHFGDPNDWDSVSAGVAAPSDAMARLNGFMDFNAALAFGRNVTLVDHDLGGEAVAILQYTGGTTGISKGAKLSHRSLVASMLSSEAWLRPGLDRTSLTGQYNIVCALPLYHVFALCVCGLLGLRTGARNILIPNPRDLDAMISAVAAYKAHIFPGVNTLYQALLAHPRFAELDFSQLAVANAGGMAVQARVASDWLKATGTAIIEGYGLSETCAGVLCNRTDADTFTGTVGLPMPGIDIRIVDDDGRDVEPGKRGEIVIMGPQVMAGYWGHEAEAALAFTDDGYFKSGDIGVMDDAGYVRIVDRKKDMILVSGFNVFPAEVEEVALQHASVLECAAVGVPDDRTGESVTLYVVRRDAGLTAEELLAYCGQRMAAYKRPRRIEFRSSLPKSNVGKILRRLLRQPDTLE